jgi:hypothetical protein
MKPNVLALIRFSYLKAKPTSFKIMKGKTLEQRAAILFDPVRLAARFALFEAV